MTASDARFTFLEQQLLLLLYVVSCQVMCSVTAVVRVCTAIHQYVYRCARRDFGPNQQVKIFHIHAAAAVAQRPQRRSRDMQ